MTNLWISKWTACSLWYSIQDTELPNKHGRFNWLIFWDEMNSSIIKTPNKNCIKIRQMQGAATAQMRWQTSSWKLHIDIYGRSKETKYNTSLKTTGCSRNCFFQFFIFVLIIGNMWLAKTCLYVCIVHYLPATITPLYP